MFLSIYCSHTQDVHRMHICGGVMLTLAGHRISFTCTGRTYAGSRARSGCTAHRRRLQRVFRSSAISSQGACRATSRYARQGTYVSSFSTSSCSYICVQTPAQHAQECRRPSLREVKMSALQCSPRCLSLMCGTSVPMTDVLGCRSRILTDGVDKQTPLEGAPSCACAFQDKVSLSDSFSCCPSHS